MPPVVQTVLTIMGVLAGLIVMAASTVAFFRANLAKAQIADLRNDRDDEKTRGDRMERDLVEERTLRITLEEKVRVLEQVVTGREQLEHIETLIIQHDKRIDDRHNELATTLNRLIYSVEATTESTQGLSGALLRHLGQGTA